MKSNSDELNLNKIDWNEVARLEKEARRQIQETRDSCMQKAIDYFDKKLCVCDNNNDITEKEREFFTCASIALEWALEKRKDTPYSIKKLNKTVSGIKITEYSCPLCDYIIDETQNDEEQMSHIWFCPNCGQKINWR